MKRTHTLDSLKRTHTLDLLLETGCVSVSRTYSFTGCVSVSRILSVSRISASRIATFSQPRRMRRTETAPAESHKPSRRLRTSRTTETLDDSVMATPRSKLIDPELPLHYHLVSRCVRRSFLCGEDPVSGKSYEHRKDWLEQRMLALARSFALEIDAYAIMSNHFHIVIYFDPKAGQSWSDGEVADRWTRAFPSRAPNGSIDHSATDQIRTLIAQSPDLAARRREVLGSLSMFMKYLKQPIAYRANKEDGCSGHFFEQRFYSGAILDEPGLIAAMAYVDLNPVRAATARSLEACQHTSVQHRLNGLTHTAHRLKRAIKPIISGLNTVSQRVSMSLEGYLDLLEQMIHADTRPQEIAWAARIANIGKYQRAHGCADVLSDWITARGFRPLEAPIS